MKHSFETGERSVSKSIKNGPNKMSKDPKYSGIGVRHLQSLLLTLAVFCGYLQRVNLSVTIVAITNTDQMINATEIEDRKPQVYEWDSEIRNYILSSFFVGYLVVNFPAALMGVHFNNKMLLTITFFVTSILSCITPFVIKYQYEGSIEILQYIYYLSGHGNWRALIVLRCFQGMIQAFLFPTIHAIIARWSPEHERSFLVGLIMSGIPLGTMATLSISGILSESIGWPYVFYASGLVGIGWMILWIFLGSSSPANNTLISTVERQYIYDHVQHDAEGNKRIPWRDILTSPPMWAIIIAHTGHNWGYWLLLQEMPTFINKVLNFDVKSDGLLSALPYMGMWLLQFPIMYIADHMVKHQVISISLSRKLWNTIGMWGAAISLVILGYLDDDTKLAIILYIVIVSISSCVNIGFNINHIDLTPNYAGILMGLSNGFAASGGLGAPLLVVYIVHDMKSVLQWRMVFFTGAGILFVANLIFLIFGSGKTQKWNSKFSNVDSCS